MLYGKGHGRLWGYGCDYGRALGGQRGTTKGMESAAHAWWLGLLLGCMISYSTLILDIITKQYPTTAKPPEPNCAFIRSFVPSSVHPSYHEYPEVLST